ncbi:hypothetical protein D3C80_1790100 [compost metagenome]
MLLGFGTPRLVQSQIQRQIVTELQQPGVIVQLCLADRISVLFQLPVNARSTPRFILQIAVQLRTFFS